MGIPRDSFDTRDPQQKPTMVTFNARYKGLESAFKQQFQNMSFVGQRMVVNDLVKDLNRLTCTCPSEQAGLSYINPKSPLGCRKHQQLQQVVVILRDLVDPDLFEELQRKLQNQHAPEVRPRIIRTELSPSYSDIQPGRIIDWGIYLGRASHFRQQMQYFQPDSGMSRASESSQGSSNWMRDRNLPSETSISEFDSSDDEVETASTSGSSFYCPELIIEKPVAADNAVGQREASNGSFTDIDNSGVKGESSEAAHESQSPAHEIESEKLERSRRLSIALQDLQWLGRAKGDIDSPDAPWKQRRAATERERSQSLPGRMPEPDKQGGGYEHSAPKAHRSQSLPSLDWLPPAPLDVPANQIGCGDDNNKEHVFQPPSHSIHTDYRRRSEAIRRFSADNTITEDPEIFGGEDSFMETQPYERLQQGTLGDTKGQIRRFTSQRRSPKGRKSVEAMKRTASSSGPKSRAALDTRSTLGIGKTTLVRWRSVLSAVKAW